MSDLYVSVSESLKLYVVSYCLFGSQFFCWGVNIYLISGHKSRNPLFVSVDRLKVGKMAVVVNKATLRISLIIHGPSEVPTLIVS